MDEEDVAVGFLDLLAEVEEVLTTFLDHLVHLPIIVDDDSVVHLQHCISQRCRKFIMGTYVGFRSTELELDNGNFCFLHSCRASSRSDNVLVQNDAFHEFGIFDGTSNLFHYPDISEIDVGRGGGDESGNGIDSDGSKSRGVLGDDLQNVMKL